MVAADAALGRMADLPGPGGVQHAERLLFSARVAGAHRGDQHQHLVYGRAEGRAVRTQPPTRQVRIPNQLGPDAFRRNPDCRRGGRRRRDDLRPVHRTSDRRRRLQGHRDLHRRLDRGADRANLRRRTREDPRLRAVSAADTGRAAGLVQPHPVLQAGQGISDSPRRIGVDAQRRQLGTADEHRVFSREYGVRLADKVSAEFFRRLLAGRGFDVESTSKATASQRVESKW